MIRIAARLALALALAPAGAALVAASAHATAIEEVLEPPATPGNAWGGTFRVTPSQPLWAFGVGNDGIQDTSISGIASIAGLEANDHWISALISQAAWAGGFDFDSIRPIGATPPSSFAVDTAGVPWQWDDAEYVAFYWLSEAGPDPASPLAVLQAGTTYDAFRFFSDGPDSPFAAFTAADGGDIVTGETIVTVVPEPSSGALALLGLAMLVGARRAAFSAPRGSPPPGSPRRGS